MLRTGLKNIKKRKNGVYTFSKGAVLNVKSQTEQKGRILFIAVIIAVNIGHVEHLKTGQFLLQILIILRFTQNMHAPFFRANAATAFSAF